MRPVLVGGPLPGPSSVRLHGPAVPCSIEKRRRVARAVVGGEPLELAQEVGLSMMRAAHVGDECRPFVLVVLRPGVSGAARAVAHYQRPAEDHGRKPVGIYSSATLNRLRYAPGLSYLAPCAHIPTRSRFALTSAR